MTVITVGIDLRQFFSHPFATGIQRVLLGLLDTWPDSVAEAKILCEFEGELYFTDRRSAAACLRLCFDYEKEYQRWNTDLKSLVTAELATHPLEATGWPDAALSVDRWLVAEPTIDPTLLRNAVEAASIMPTTLLYYDALPQVRPEFYRTYETAFWSPYARLAASSSSVVSISDTVARVLHDRLRNTNPGAGGVAYPGADHVPLGSSDAPSRTSFLVLSTVEKRKRFDLVVEAFAIASKRIPGLELHIVGRRSSAASLVESFEGVSGEGNVRWSRAVSDAKLIDIAALSTALITVGEEGYGMPTLEMLRRGLPVVFAGEQPAAELAEGRGARRLREQSADALAEEMIRLSDPKEAALLRSEIDSASFPTWSEFSRRVAEAAAAFF